LDGGDADRRARERLSPRSASPQAVHASS
jgi:hypothetical protein